MSVDRHDDDSLAPPYALRAEQAVLGAIMLDNRAWDRVYDLVSESDFYRADHRAIWRELGRLIEANKPADAITLSQRLEGSTLAYLVELMQGHPSAANVRAHAQIVRDKAILRSLLSLCADIEGMARDVGAEAQAVAEQAEARVLGVLDRDARDQAREPVPLKTAVFEAVDWLETERAGGLSTGYARLDAMLSGGGMQPEQLVIIAGRPSMGKSSLAYCIAEHAAAAGQVVSYFALETSRRDIGKRAILWHQEQLGRTEATRWLSDLPLVIDDSAGVSLSHVRIRCRRIRRQRQGLGLIVIDYMQMMRHRAESRLQEVSEISRGLKAIAKEFQVPVVAVAQLNRQTEGRTDKRPQLADLRESGQLEQDADVIMMCYREEYYDPNTHLRGFGEVLVRKNRDGPTGEALLRWDGPRTRWIDYAGERPRETVQAGSASVREFRPQGGAA